MTGLEGVLDAPHPSRGQVGRARRRWNELASDRHHFAGAIVAVEQATAVYRAAAERKDEVAVASAPILAVQVVDEVDPLIAAVRAELAQARAHLAQAVHAMHEQERRADEGDDVIRALVWAYGDNSDEKMERAVIDGISHLHEPGRAAERARQAAVASALEAAAYAKAAKARRAGLVVAS